jgi:outer membrane protein assembly factor BamB
LRKAFSTPIIIESGGRELLISPGSFAVFAYDPLTGKEMWKVTHNSFSPSVAPLFHDGLVMAAAGWGTPELLAIRPDGKGDVTDTHVVWRFMSKDVTVIPSPIAADGLIYMVSNKGTLTCLEAKTGEPVWRERTGGIFIASLLADGERIYVPNTSGKTRVIRPENRFVLLAENDLDEGMMASPVAIDNALILRTKTHLYRIEEKTQ